MQGLALSDPVHSHSSWKEDAQTSDHEWTLLARHGDGDCGEQSWRPNEEAGAHGEADGGEDMAGEGK